MDEFYTMVLPGVLKALLEALPAEYRVYVGATLAALIAMQTTTSLIVARLPKSIADHPVYGKYARALHWFGHARFHDELGTIKAPFSAAPARGSETATEQPRTSPPSSDSPNP